MIFIAELSVFILILAFIMPMTMPLDFKTRDDTTPLPSHNVTVTAAQTQRAFCFTLPPAMPAAFHFAAVTATRQSILTYVIISTYYATYLYGRQMSAYRHFTKAPWPSQPRNATWVILRLPLSKTKWQCRYPSRVFHQPGHFQRRHARCHMLDNASVDER